MLIKPATLPIISIFFLVPSVFASESQPSAEKVAAIETHAASWDLVLKREYLKAMVANWRTLISDPDSAAVYFGEMLPVANSVVDRLVVTTGYSRGMLMRWLESDVGLQAYFFPPYPDLTRKDGGGGIWRILKSLVPIILYRLVDQVIGH